jgi:hypothetical protein
MSAVRLTNGLCRSIVCTGVRHLAALVSMSDLADRALRALADGLDTPHLPHAWECGFLMEERTSTYHCATVKRHSHRFDV